MTITVWSIDAPPHPHGRFTVRLQRAADVRTPSHSGMSRRCGRGELGPAVDPLWGCRTSMWRVVEVTKRFRLLVGASALAVYLQQEPRARGVAAQI